MCDWNKTVLISHIRISFYPSSFLLYSLLNDNFVSFSWIQVFSLKTFRECLLSTIILLYVSDGSLNFNLLILIYDFNLWLLKINSIARCKRRYSHIHDERKKIIHSPQIYQWNQIFIKIFLLTQKYHNITNNLDSRNRDR